jgi:hypothetical protein
VLSGESSVTVRSIVSNEVPSEVDATVIIGVAEIVENATPSCDIDRDGTVDARDIDFLTLAIRTGVFSAVLDPDAVATFDLNNDGNVDNQDLTTLVTSAACLNTSLGDADLDGDVDSDDFNILSFNFGLENTASWSDGDFNGDGNVDSDDFNILLFNFGN